MQVNGTTCKDMDFLANKDMGKDIKGRNAQVIAQELVIPEPRTDGQAISDKYSSVIRQES